MAILHVRGVPDELYERIRKRARTANRSISAEVLWLLERALSGPRTLTLAEAVEEVRHQRERLTLPPGAPDSVELLREGREERLRQLAPDLVNSPNPREIPGASRARG